MKKIQLQSKYGTFFLIVWCFIGFQSIFTMNSMKVNQVILPSTGDMVLSLLLLHTYPTKFNHFTVCSIALVDKRCFEYVLKKAELVRESVKTGSMLFSGNGNVQRLWHPYGSAYYQTYNPQANTLEVKNVELGQESIGITFTDVLGNTIDDINPCINKDGIYRCYLNGPSSVFKAYETNGKSMECFGRIDNGNESMDISLSELICTPDFLKRVLRFASVKEESKIITNYSHGFHPNPITRSYLIYNLNGLQIPDAVQKIFSTCFLNHSINEK